MSRFPSPRYHSSSPYPSLLSPVSPFPYPVPYPLGPPYDSIGPLPLFGSELHLRIILQSIASQIDEIWTHHLDQDSACQAAVRAEKQATMLARDFMIVSVPSHELAGYETQTITEHLSEVAVTTQSWVEHGGVHVPAGKGEEWVGIDPEPTC